MAVEHLQTQLGRDASSASPGVTVDRLQLVAQTFNLLHGLGVEAALPALATTAIESLARIPATYLSDVVANVLLPWHAKVVAVELPSARHLLQPLLARAAPCAAAMAAADAVPRVWPVLHETLDVDCAPDLGFFHCDAVRANGLLRATLSIVAA
ncbi:hypothetical protein SDRG_15028 [Saprolegnia diclina VS20]|uniref:Uncharacterized protein n=1 Tax=Saprolegnia diclina (strain VS20) TaxID=1156394 RepID=T0RC17_SAPDV|nr:hypothetical protein SDRG_15028 [Saprolegnia diclina VS20]EQC27127.1 hypothetical protein SDRG_15028 [Saprolegnia diclina VS20]|eukprot:XP_008619413.1 hypothetical protein SDRG_15028 [Saprolegnia diclina VS20]